MSQIGNDINTLKHMDEALATMRQALNIVVTSTNEMTEVLTLLWGEGQNVPIAGIQKFHKVQELLDGSDKWLLAAQVELVHAMTILVDIAGGGV